MLHIGIICVTYNAKKTTQENHVHWHLVQHLILVCTDVGLISTGPKVSIYISKIFD